MDLSLIIPAYNEGAKIEQDLRTTLEFLRARPERTCEVLVVDDGSTDDTREVVERFARAVPPTGPQFRLLAYGENRGKGAAVKHGMLHAEGDVVAFMDSGLCVPVRFLDVGLAKIAEGFDFAIASRRLPGTKITRAQPLYRRAGSKVFGKLMRGFMGISVSDTQCGFKLYRHGAARAIYSRVTTDGFMFDIEALLIAKELGLKGAEFAVEWANDEDTRYSPFRGTLRNFKELAVIRVKRWSGRVKVRGFQTA